MGKGSSPSAPDPDAVANAQLKLNTQTGNQQAALSRYDQYGPTGSSTWSITGYNSDGTPHYTNQISLNPQQQAIYQGQLGQDANLMGVQNGLINQINANMVGGGGYGKGGSSKGDMMPAPRDPTGPSTASYSSGPTMHTAMSGTDWSYTQPRITPAPAPASAYSTANVPAISAGAAATQAHTISTDGIQPVQGGMNPAGFNNWASAFQTTAGAAPYAATSGAQGTSAGGSAQAGAQGYGASNANAQGYNAANAGAQGYGAANAGSQGYQATTAGYSSAGPSASAQGATANAGQSGAALGSGWGIQQALNGAGDLQGQFNAARDAALQSQMGYLQPQFDQQSQQLQDQLRQQGITQASNPAAYQHAMDQINRDQTFQRQQAYDSSFNTGLNSANQLFNQSLQAGQFSNAAQAQGFGQSAQNAQMLNQIGMANAANQTQAGLATAANQTNAGIASMQAQNQQNQFNAGQANAQQQFNAGQQNAAGQFGANAYNTAALSNQAAQNQAAAFGASAQNTAALQNAAAQNAAGQFGAAAQNTASLSNQAAANQAAAFGAGAQNAAALQNATLANQQNQFNAGQANNMAQFNSEQANQIALANTNLAAQRGQFNAQLNNAAQNSLMAGYAQNAGLNNAANAQGMQNMFSLNNLPINQLSALRGLTQVQMPNANNNGAVQGQAAPNYGQYAQNAYQGQLGAYNNNMNGLFSLGNAAVNSGAFSGMGGWLGSTIGDLLPFVL